MPRGSHGAGSVSTPVNPPRGEMAEFNSGFAGPVSPAFGPGRSRRRPAHRGSPARGWRPRPDHSRRAVLAVTARRRGQRSETDRALRHPATAPPPASRAGGRPPRIQEWTMRRRPWRQHGPRRAGRPASSPVSKTARPARPVARQAPETARQCATRPPRLSAHSRRPASRVHGPETGAGGVGVFAMRD